MGYIYISVRRFASLYLWGSKRESLDQKIVSPGEKKKRIYRSNNGRHFLFFFTPSNTCLWIRIQLSTIYTGLQDGYYLSCPETKPPVPAPARMVKGWRRRSDISIQNPPLGTDGKKTGDGGPTSPFKNLTPAILPAYQSYELWGWFRLDLALLSQSTYTVRPRSSSKYIYTLRLEVLGCPRSIAEITGCIAISVAALRRTGRKWNGRVWTLWSDERGLTPFPPTGYRDIIISPPVIANSN